MSKRRLTRSEAEWRIITRAWRDEAFSKELRENPKAAVGKELGVEFEDDAQVVVHQETPRSLHFVLPVKPAAAPRVDQGEVFVRDQAGAFYEIPADVLSDFAVSEAGRLQTAAKAWEGEAPDVEGQRSSSWKNPCPCGCCAVRG